MIKNSDSCFVKTVQKFVAREAVGQTAMRNQGTGVLNAVHIYLDEINLALMKTNSRSDYMEWLDHHTMSLLNKLPVRSKPWGAARKAINLFMRTALYNRYLNHEFKLEGVETWMEIPLDSAVARGLRKEVSRGSLPQWPGLKKLTRQVSNQFQTFAQSLADRRDLARAFTLICIFGWRIDD